MKVAANIGRNREARRYRQAESGHAGESCALFAKHTHIIGPAIGRAAAEAIDMAFNAAVRSSWCHDGPLLVPRRLPTMGHHDGETSLPVLQRSERGRMADLPKKSASASDHEKRQSQMSLVSAERLRNSPSVPAIRRRTGRGPCLARC